MYRVINERLKIAVYRVENIPERFKKEYEHLSQCIAVLYNGHIVLNQNYPDYEMILDLVITYLESDKKVRNIVKEEFSNPSLSKLIKLSDLVSIE